jgi:hypothetical protein
MNALVALTLIVVSCPAALALQESSSVETRFHRVYLRNGNFIDGQMIKDSSTEIVLKLGVGEMAIGKDQIDRVELVRMRSLRGEPKDPKTVESPRADRKASQPPTSPPASPAAQSPASAIPSGTPEKIRERIDGLISGWRFTREKKTQITQEDLAKNFEEVGAEGVPYLGWLLEERPKAVPVRSISIALGRLGDAKGLTSLGRLLQSKDPENRLSAAIGLGLIEKADVEPYLMAALDDEVAEVWQAASQSLVDRMRKDRDERLTTAVLSRLTKAKVKAPYAITLGRAGGREAHREILELLRLDDENDQKAALQGLTQLNDPEDGEAVNAFFRRATPPLQKEACLLLGKLKYRPAVGDLIERLRQDANGLRANAHWALREITGQSLPPNPELWEAWWETTGKLETKK